MNFTYYFYCEDESCGFDKAVHQYGEEVTLQCKKCFTIEAKVPVQAFHLECVACGKEQALEGEVSFDPRMQEMCPSCGLSGEIGFEKGENVLWVLGTDMKTSTPCSNCQKEEWAEIIDTKFTCPYCFKELKQKMSMAWDEKKQEE